MGTSSMSVSCMRVGTSSMRVNCKSMGTISMSGSSSMNMGTVYYEWELYEYGYE